MEGLLLSAKQWIDVGIGTLGSHRTGLKLRESVQLS